MTQYTNMGQWLYLVRIYDLNYYEAVKLTSLQDTLSNFTGNTVTGGTSGVVVDVVAVLQLTVLILTHYLLNIKILVLIMFQINLQTVKV